MATESFRALSLGASCLPHLPCTSRYRYSLPTPRGLPAYVRVVGSVPWNSGTVPAE